MRTLRIGSRESRLAVVQAQIVMAAIRARRPGIAMELVTMKTSGDRLLSGTLEQAGGKGLFVRELDEALLEGRVDLAVHSAKDLPVMLSPVLPVAAFSVREDPRDALVLPLGAAEMGEGAIGCSSRRRAAQLSLLYPDRRVEPVRGNVLTRLEKLDRGEYAALVLAAAGLKRLGLAGRISRIFSPEEMLPAAGQGLLAVQSRLGEEPSVLGEICGGEAGACLRAERAFVAELGGGCSAVVAAYAEIRRGKLVLTGMTEDLRRACRVGEMEEGEALGRSLALEMKGERA